MPAANAMFSGARPDFSGDYVLNRPASVLEGGAAAVSSATLRIEHRDPVVRLEAEFAFGGASSRFVLEHHGPESPTPSSLEWEGDALVFEHASDAPDAPMRMWWRYELGGDRRRLTAKETLRAPGRDQDNVWVFDRVEL